jgi:hypothetical protein
LVGQKQLINTEKKYNVFLSKDTGPADFADFLIDLGEVFTVNINNKSSIKLKYFRHKSHTLQEWVKFFKEKLPKILNDEECFPNFFKILFTKAYRKLDEGKKLSTNQNNNNNSSEPPKEIPFDVLGDNFGLDNFKNEQIEINDEDLIELNNDDDDNNSKTPVLKSYDEQNNIPFPLPQTSQESSDKSTVNDIFNFVSSNISTNSYHLHTHF